MKQNSRIQLENTLIGALGVLSLVLFILSFLPGLGLANRVGILLEMGHMVQRAFSVVLFILTFQLWKRKRAAWNIAVLLLFLSFLRGLTALSSPLYLPFHLAEAVLFLLLLCFRKDFCCPSDRRSLGRSLLILLLALAGIIVNAGISYHFSVKPLGETSLDSLMDASAGQGCRSGQGQGVVQAHRLRRSCGKGQQHPDHLRPQSGKDACHRGQLPWPRRIRYPLLFIIQKTL